MQKKTLELLQRKQEENGMLINELKEARITKWKKVTLLYLHEFTHYENPTYNSSGKNLF